mmetsp:Transcript_29237/g.48305  ORF Transcript_29237/g.48305 Transcript_29237/m.48305 type:complete len:224 (+) Transcript_29237:79-750(+)|eukprot:CAMPEP_0119008590 /NCGR_PEP_ID=MMETSP1176-20130426/3807_1 /TAXON_ID=265551 /ORGANISM="Synedropsis recta cf, Strain CCMP1620" /LENGTH=223 /DNA_ID=CAMNT_0006960951 /DNA_START=53 /DNA_END=724 /DNA_ORIENTATION=-
MTHNLSEKLRELLLSVEDSEYDLRDAKLEIQALNDELLDMKQLVEFWKGQARNKHGGSSRPPSLIHEETQNHLGRNRTVSIDVVEFRAAASQQEMSTTSSSASHRAIMTELYNAIDELCALPDDLLPVLVMMDNILKCKKYHQCLWLDTTCDLTQRFGHWTKLKLRSLELKSHPAVAFHDIKWAPKTKEGLKSFVCLLVELCDEFQELCENKETNSMEVTSCA